MKWNELVIEQKKDLVYKIQTAHEAIERAFEVSTCPALAFSGGKDSTVLLHLIRTHFIEQSKSMAVIYGNTGVEYPECVAFTRKLAVDWDLNFHEARPGRTTEPGYKYAAQRLIWDRLIQDGTINSVLKPDGKLKSTEALERSCPIDLANLFHSKEREWIWPAGTLMSYWWCADQYGWPILGKSWSKLSARRINVDTFLRFSKSASNDPKLLAYYNVLCQSKISQHCCQVLKKDPSELVQAELGVDLIFKGLMASESRSRTKNFLTRGYLFEGADRKHLQGRPFFHCQPLAIWTDADIWEYIRQYHVPYASLYDMTFYNQDGVKEHVKRNGCLGCATDFGYKNNHQFVLRQTHRSSWRAIMRNGMGAEIRRLQNVLRAGQMMLFDGMETNELIDAQPCVFDDLDGLGGIAPPPRMVYDPEMVTE